MTSIPALISLEPSSPWNKTMISMIANYSRSFLPSLNGASTFKERHTQSLSLPIIRTCPTSKIPANSLVDKLIGLYFCRTSTLSGRFSPVQNLPPLTPFLVTKVHIIGFH